MRKTFVLAVSGILFTAGVSQAQVCHNLYPCAECAVADNSGNDLYGYVTTNKKDAAFKADKINEYSGGIWGYIQIKDVRVPSLNIHPTAENKKVDLDYSQYIDATLALHKGMEGMEATWWARQCNNREGALYNKKTDLDTKVDANVVRYGNVMHDLETKKFTLVEYNNDQYNEVDYDVLLKNYVLLENGIVKNDHDYKVMIYFYNNMLTKFTYQEDPLLDNSSFVTFFTAGNTRYIGYFNMINAKLAGHVEQVKIEYEKDKDPLLDRVFKKLKGKTIFVYGDDVYGMEHNMLKYGHNNHLKMIRRKTDMTDRFNTAK